MDKKNLQELAKLGLSKKTISLMTESEAKLLFEKINKKKETKEATQDVEKKTTLAPTDVFNNVTVDQMEKLTKVKKPLVKKEQNVPLDTKTVKNPSELSDEIKEGKKKKKKYNPWAVCTTSVGRKNKKKYEDCVMGVKKKLKEGKNPYEYIIESKMEEIVENHLAPKISKKELIQIVQEKKMMMMKKPIGKSTMIGGEIGEGETKTKEKEKVTTQPKIKPPHPGKKPSDAPAPAKAMMKGETMEGDTKTAPNPVRTTPAQPKTRPGSPNRNPNPDIKQAPAKAEQKKEEIINAITKLIGKGK